MKAARREVKTEQREKHASQLVFKDRTYANAGHKQHQKRETDTNSKLTVPEKLNDKKRA